MEDGLIIDRRTLLAGAGAAAALAPAMARAQGAARPILFTHITVISGDQSIDDRCVAVVGDKIAAIGATDDLMRRYQNAEIYDGRGKAIMPGLVNCHAHLFQTLERGFNEDFGFPNNAGLKVRPYSLMSADERVLFTAMGALEAIRSGTTTLVENLGDIAPNAATLASTGLRMVFAESVNDTENVAGAVTPERALGPAPVFSAKKREEGIGKITDLYSRWNGKENGRIRVFPAAALAETSSPELMRWIREFAEKNDTNYTVHLSQSKQEVAYMKRSHGVSPVGFLDRHGFLSSRLFAAHCRYVDDADIAMLARSRTIISHQAGMAANRGNIPPIYKLRAAGCPIALGTDNNVNDVFEVMRIALLTERIDRNDDFPGTVPQPEDVFIDATQGGALATRGNGGVVEAGKKADLIVVNMMQAHLVPAGRFLSAWIHNGHASDIETVMVDGRFLMRDRKVLTMDETAMIAEADKASRRIWGQVKASGPIPIPGHPNARN